MKKRILICLVISMAIFGYFYQNRQDKIVKKVEIEERKEITQLDKNITVSKKRVITQPPTVEAGADQNITFG